MQGRWRPGVNLTSHDAKTARKAEESKTPTRFLHVRNALRGPDQSEFLVRSWLLQGSTYVPSTEKGGNNAP